MRRRARHIAAALQSVSTKSACITALCATLLALLLAPPAHAQLPQPDIELLRTVVKWPTVEVYFKSTFGNTVTSKTVTESNFRVYENGKEIKDFTIECRSVRDSVSVVMVLDGSWQTWGTPGYSGQIGADRFLAKLDSLIDEVAVIAYRDAVKMHQTLTHDFPAVRIAIDSALRSNAPLSLWDDGGVWDAVMMGCEVLVQNAKNPNKVVMLYSVEENFPCQPWRPNCLSYANLVIPYAQQHEIHCMVLPYFRYPKPMWRLDSLARLTGGTLYQKPNGENYNSTEIPPVMEQIAKDIIDGFDDCKIVFKSDCPDGTKREVQVEFTYP